MTPWKIINAYRISSHSFIDKNLSLLSPLALFFPLILIISVTDLELIPHENILDMIPVYFSTLEMLDTFVIYI